LSATPQLVKDLAPELAAQGDPRIALFITMAEVQVDEDRWGPLADMGTAYLTAHLLTVAGATAGGGVGSAGPVLSETVGRVSRSYASTVSSSAYVDSLGATRYGREFSRLRGLLSLTPEVL
jgi:hypothetical protein